MPVKSSKVKTEKSRVAAEVTVKRGRPKKAVVTKAGPVKTKAPKKASKKTSGVKLPVDLSQIQSYLLSLRQNTAPTLAAVKAYRPNARVYIAAAVAVILILAVYNKSLFIAATVDGSPISNFELQSRLNQQYRDQTLNEMINEKIVLDAAKKQGIIISPTEVDSQISTLEKSVGGADALDGLLAQQGETRTALRDQVLLQLTIEKMYSGEASVSASEVQQYIDQNKDQMQATDSAGQQKEAENALKQQKLTQIFQQKFQQLKQAAQVQIF